MKHAAIALLVGLALLLVPATSSCSAGQTVIEYVTSDQGRLSIYRVLHAAYTEGGNVIIAKSKTEDEARERLAVYEAKWNPVWKAWMEFSRHANRETFCAVVRLAPVSVPGAGFCVVNAPPSAYGNKIAGAS